MIFTWRQQNQWNVIKNLEIDLFNMEMEIMYEKHGITY